jgi:hypothetical protein
MSLAEYALAAAAIIYAVGIAMLSASLFIRARIAP